MPLSATKKRKLDTMVVSAENEVAQTTDAQAPTCTGSSSTQQSPHKKGRTGITAAQKQALIDDLQLEITNRARKLRSEYHARAETLRERLERRMLRIPEAKRSQKMGDLIARCAAEQQRDMRASSSTSLPPPVPPKDTVPSRRQVPKAPGATRVGIALPSVRPARRPSNVLHGGDKENQGGYFDSPRKQKLRGSPEPETKRDAVQALSPTTTNMNPVQRVAPSPTKFKFGQAVPAKKASAANMLSNMVEKARSTRAAAAARKPSMSSSSPPHGQGTTDERIRRGGPPLPTTTRSTAISRADRRVSGTSESSDGTTSTVVRKPVPSITAAANPAPLTSVKRSVMSTIKQGVAGTRRTQSTKTTSAQATGTARVLRKRA